MKKIISAPALTIVPQQSGKQRRGLYGLHRECLMKEEIPVCFYRMEPNMDRKQDYTYKGFAAFCESTRENNIGVVGYWAFQELQTG